MSVSVVERIVGTARRPCLTPLTETGSKFLLQYTRTNNIILTQSFVLQDMLGWLKRRQSSMFNLYQNHSSETIAFDINRDPDKRKTPREKCNIYLETKLHQPELVIYPG